MYISSATKTSFSLFLVLFFSCFQLSQAQIGSKTFSIQNAKLKVTVSIDQDGYLASDSVYARPAWSKQYGERPFGISSDAGFKLNFMWSAWRAPGKSRNGENLINLTQHNFTFADAKKQQTKDGAEQLIMTFKGIHLPLEVRVVYQIEKDHFYARRKLEVRATEIKGYNGEHYLRQMWPVSAYLKTEGKIIKKGGFGQPVAMQSTRNPQTGMFWGMEYPTAQNTLKKEGDFLKLEIGDYYGRQVDTSWTSGDWVVIGLTPQPQIRQWFMKYVADIEAKPVRPYLLYNSWYDLESPQNVHDAKRVMNEKNSLRSIQQLQDELTQKRGVHLNAFVLDDGWDVYRSDWEISEKQFPHGFKPLVNQLNKTHIDLGIWFGPIGGYSHRNWRLDWMKQRGFETIGNDQLDIAGTKYHRMFKDRVIDFTKNRDVAYYKWDGIQFSSSNPANGHPIGIYSRRAVMDSVIDLSQAVWKQNPNAFLNITSGTWLSPWWVKYANTIWMQGGDYGYTNVPSISQRDRAITYRDLSLYNDFKTKDSWFPIANLMTHGIIKGDLQNLAAAEPLDKFTNNALLYFSRGVAMWELYISPDLLTGTQWDVLAQGIKWAKDRFDLLKHTVMIGGDPGKGEPYGYAHFKDRRGIVVVRNPQMEEQTLTVSLNSSLGLAGNSDSLVVERVYPQKKISETLASSGSKLHIKLTGYETAIYEVFPLKDADRPLLAGATFSTSQAGGNYNIKVLDVDEKSGGAHFLNPGRFPDMQQNHKSIKASEITLASAVHDPIVQQVHVSHPNAHHLVVKMKVNGAAVHASFAVLLETTSEAAHAPQENPSLELQIDGQPKKITSEVQKGQWGWYTIPVDSGSHTVDIQLDKTPKLATWTGQASVWFEGYQKVKPQEITVSTKVKVPVFPPVINPVGTVKRQQKLGTFNMTLH